MLAIGAFLISICVHAATPGSEIEIQDNLRRARESSQSMELRWNAVMNMAKFSSSEVRKDLMDFTSAPEWFMRNAGLLALQIVDPMAAHERAFQMLSDKALVVRSQAVASLTRKLTPSQRELLWKELEESYNYRKGKSLWIRAEILGKLAEFPSKEELNQFSRYLADSDQQVVPKAIAGLEKLSGRQVEGTTTQSRAKKWLSLVNTDRDSLIR